MRPARGKRHHDLPVGDGRDIVLDARADLLDLADQLPQHSDQGEHCFALGVGFSLTGLALGSFVETRQ
jgi:hypothetical protein